MEVKNKICIEFKIKFIFIYMFSFKVINDMGYTLLIWERTSHISVAQAI